MGSDDGHDDEKPAHTNELLDYDYWISRNPITNAQFEAFVKAGGYGQRRYWEAAEEAGYWKSGGFKGRVDDEPRSRLHDFGSRFHLANQPVVGVSWYEVLAFTQWLSEQWREQGILDENWRVCLPSEAEWEKAAKGGIEIPKAPVWMQAKERRWGSAKITEFEENSDRIYPWGDTPDTEKANYNDTGIGSPSAVGCFLSGASPYGCLDMAGNVWEWTRSLWGEDWQTPRYGYPHRFDDDREDLKANDKTLRVVRGGSFLVDRFTVRCASRARYNPCSADRYRGFRVVITSVQNMAIV
jgi:formylglycine-generating enzyme required for sulfatase activity